MSLLSKLLHAPRTIALLLAALVFSNAAYAQVPFNLIKGWNLLGNSSASAIDVTTAFSDKSKFTTVWTWNKAASKWAFYSPSMTSTELTAYALNKQYDVLTSIAPKEGFWVNAATAATLTGPVANGVTLAESDLQAGWNLLGSADKATPSQLNQGLSASLGAAGKAMTTAWAWDAQGTAWRFYAPSLEAQSAKTLADYIASKQYLAFSVALSESEGFWLNIGSITPTTNAAFVTAPVVNTPLDGVTVTLTCASGAIGGKGTASQGNVRIAVDPATCLAPYTMAVSGAGTMAGPDLKFGTADDETYDSTTRASLKSVIQSTDLGLTAGANLSAGASVTAPAITSLTTMVAEAVAKPNFATPPTPAEISAAIANVQKVTGLTNASDVYANPLTNGAVFNAATLVNEMVANAVKADSSQAPNALLKYMALNTTGVTLNDTTINPATLMGASAASTTVLDAQMATMQAKAGAMKSVADAIFANLGSASQAGVTPADAVTFLNTALAGSSAATAQQAIAQAQLAQNTMTQMAAQMVTMQSDTSIAPADLAAKMAAMAQGLNSVRVTQDQSIQAAIGNAGSDATLIANAVKTANTTAQSMITASAASLLSTVTSANAATLTNQYMSSIAGSITEQLGKIDATQLATATSGPPANLAAALANIGVDPATMASAAATTAGQVSTLTPPSALTNFAGLGDQVIGMVLARAGAFGWMTSAQLQAWVDAIGTALGTSSNIPLLNQGSVGMTIANYFASQQPDLRTVPSSTLALTIGAAPTFMPVTIPTGAPPVSSLPLCSALPSTITPITSGTTQNCNPATSTGGGTLPLCSTLGTSAQPGANCTPDSGTGGTGGTTLPLCSTLGAAAIGSGPTQNCTPDTSGTGGTTLAYVCSMNHLTTGMTVPATLPNYGGMTCP